MEEHMKNTIKLIIIGAIILMITQSTPIIKAEKTEKTETVESMWININIIDTETNKPKIDVKIPLEMLEWAMQFDKGESQFDLNVENECNINTKEIVPLLKKAGKKFLISVVDYKSHQNIKIWID
jgi:hypothetical protein